METHPVKGYFFIMLAASLWATSGVAGKSLFASGISPLELVQVRLTFSSVLLGIFLAVGFRPLLRIRTRHLGFFLIHGGIFMSMVQVSYFFTISKIKVAAAILIEYMAPVIVGCFSMIFWKERFTLPKAAALLISLLGCYLVAGAYDLNLLSMNRIGILSGVASAFFFAGNTLMSERMMHFYHPVTVLFYALSFAALTLHLITAPFHYLYTSYTAAQWALMLYITIVGTLVPFFLFFIGVSHIRSTRAIIAATLEPILAGVVAYLFLGEALAPLQMAGGVLVVGAIVLLQLQRETDEMAPQRIRMSAGKRPDAERNSTTREACGRGEA